MDSLSIEEIYYWLGDFSAEDWHRKFHVIANLSKTETTQSAYSNKDNHRVDLIVVSPSAKNLAKETSTDNFNASSSLQLTD